MGRLADGTKIKASGKMAVRGNAPAKSSSIENRKSQHKLAGIEMNTSGHVTKGALDGIEHFGRKRR